MSSKIKHHNILYSFVIILAIIQITTFVVISMQISKTRTDLENVISKTKRELNYELGVNRELIDKYNEVYQANFNQISSSIIKQQEDFFQELSLIKSSKEDFSGIASEAIKGVVTVTTPRSMGSGFFIAPEGYIVTNYHVIAGRENRTKIITYDKEKYSAKFIGADVRRDLALLKIEENYKSLSLADSDKLQVGKKVIAVGNPLGLSFTVTEGIISGLHRLGPSNLPEYIQTDVSLNPGNSGGPLIDTTGKVVGINNFKIGDAESLGFALESNSIKKAVNKIANKTLVE